MLAHIQMKENMENYFKTDKKQIKNFEQNIYYSMNRISAKSMRIVCIYMYVCMRVSVYPSMCVCVCVYFWEREGEIVNNIWVDLRS